MSAERRSGRLATYLSLSAAGMVASNGMAEVVHIPSEQLPQEIVNDDQLFLYFSLRAPGVENNYDIWFDPISAYGGTFMVFGGNQGTTQLLVQSGEVTAGTSVGPGTIIDASLDAPGDRFWSNGYPLDPAAFDGPRHFLPVRFPIEGDFHYAFIEIEITPEGNLRILDAAWENELGVPITTPAALNDAALTALAAGDEAADRLRRSD
jgi:hypothetical protein